ncbi:SGNH/GDSL hydrolase family protein [Enterovirga rhinocerotis]|uniref:Lysophospholipase L1-like esterase n=1 Tax=Enterovirga rhinocerotis TaxID=1339210 RepID=A0A4R7BYX7_9HYPH|nr:GDSL-type esterase/lipase family protein [Enterovirga rhinocerotis]TDR89965.1 lysophospholipase L1-like esterase [Enterovirga rhinocerotis]
MSDGAAHILCPTAPTRASALKRLAAARIPEAADIVLLGDSLAAAWPSDLVAAARPGRRILNLGLPGDRIQNTLWRIGRPDLAHLRPREVVIVLGTNNLSDGDSPAAIAAGLADLVRGLDALWERPALVLSTIPPRGSGPAACEAERQEANSLIARMETGRLRLLRSEPALAAAGDGAFAPDRLHLERGGYEALTAALAGLAD